MVKARPTLCGAGGSRCDASKTAAASDLLGAEGPEGHVEDSIGKDSSSSIALVALAGARGGNIPDAERKDVSLKCEEVSNTTVGWPLDEQKRDTVTDTEDAAEFSQNQCGPEPILPGEGELAKMSKVGLVQFLQKTAPPAVLKTYQLTGTPANVAKRTSKDKLDKVLSAIGNERRKLRRLDEIARSESLLAEAHDQLSKRDIAGARQNYAKAEELLHALLPKDAPSAPKVGAWVRVRRRKKTEKIQPTGTIIPVKPITAVKGEKNKEITVQLDSCTCEIQKVLPRDEVEDPLAVLGRLQEEIDTLEKQINHRSHSTVVEFEQKLQSHNRLLFLDHALDWLSSPIDRDGPSPSERLDQEGIERIGKRIKETFDVSEPRSVNFMESRSVNLSVKQVRTLMNDEKLRQLLMHLVPYLSDDSLHNALEFCANNLKIGCSRHEEFWPVLKPLLLAQPGVKMKTLPVLTAIQHHDKKILDLLLQADADPNYGNEDNEESTGVSALHLAVETNQGEDVVRMLLSAKADCNLKLKKKDGRFPADPWKFESTPLHQACMLADAATSERMVALLIEHGCNLDLSISNGQKKTASDIALHPSVREMLLRSQRESNVTSKSSSSKKKKKTKSASSRKPPSCSSVSQESIHSGVMPDSPADICQHQSGVISDSRADVLQDEIRKETSSLPIEERLMKLKIVLERHFEKEAPSLPSIPSIQAQGDRTASADEETKSASDNVVQNKSCTKQTSTAAESQQSRDKEELQKLPPAENEVPTPVHYHDSTISEHGNELRMADEYVSGVTKSVDVALDLGFLSNATWDLRFTREFRDQLFALSARQPLLLRSLMENLKRLAGGERGKRLYKQLKGVPKSLRIYESPVKTFNDGPRFLWQFSVDYSPRIRSFTDCIRLWRLCLQHDDVPRGIDWIIESHKRGRTSIMKKALMPSFKGSTLLPDGRRTPRQYTICEGSDLQELHKQDGLRFELLTEGEEADAQMLDEEGEEQLLFTPPAVSNADSDNVLNVLKFYQLNDEVLQSLCSFHAKSHLDQGDAVSVAHVPEFPFIPDEREDEIINQGIKDEIINSNDMIDCNNQSSILLVGRSGTGKTSIAVGRMWALYKHCHSESWHGGPKNQIFVTANKVLRDQVKKSFQGMKLGFTGVQEESPEQPHTFQDVPEGMFPLFLTQNEFLKMLDGTLANPFWPRNDDGSLVHDVASVFHEEAGMLDEMPEEDSIFSDDDHDDAAEAQQKQEQDEDSQTKKDCRRQIDFQAFFDDIWRPQLRAKAQKVSSESLFQEIHSYIKGSSDALRRPNGRLTREEYNNLGAKMAPNFQKTLGDDTQGDRSHSRDFVYDLFERYEEEKSKLGGYDISDVVFHIWNQLEQCPVGQRTPIHSIVVDETQDFTQAELALFVRVASEKNELLFSGDTVQTIAAGVGFRFEDLKSIFKHEADRQSQEMSAKAQSIPAAWKVKVPVVNTLTVNYRTHNGILKAAAGVVDLLEKFFPKSIDSLPRERGFFDGPKPMLLAETNDDDATVMIVGADRKHKKIEFGAHQVLLVRNQRAKDDLPKAFKECLAMTILESKGLEFDDVFLWNFLTDSRAKDEWRLVFSYLVQQDRSQSDAVRDDLKKRQALERDHDVGGMLRELEFNEQSHQILCSELKHFYTAITRARVRVVIYDQSAVKRAPLFYYLEKRSLCDAVSVLGQTSAHGLAVESKPEEWQVQGNNLMHRRMFRLAAQCFKKSGDTRLENACMAQDSIMHAKDGKSSHLVDTYLTAAEHFIKADNSEVEMARCCYEAGLNAAKIGELKQSREFFNLSGSTFAWLARANPANAKFMKRAIHCLRKAGSIGSAVELLVSGGRHYKQALKLLRDERRWDEALQLLESPGVPEDLMSERSTLLRESASDHAVKAANPQNRNRQGSYDAFMRVVGLMSAEDEEQHLEAHGYKQELVVRLEQRGNYAKAAKVLFSDKKSVEAAEMLCDTNPNPRIEDFEHATELLLAHAVREDCSKEARLKTLVQARQLFDRGKDTTRDNDCVLGPGVTPGGPILEENNKFSKYSEGQYGLRFCMARIDPDVNSKKNRLLQLRDACSDGDNVLMNVLVGAELNRLGPQQNLPDQVDSQEAHGSFMRDQMLLVRDVDFIIDVLSKSDWSKQPEYLRFERMFGLRRHFGTCCISPARKVILDYILECDISKRQQDTAVNAHGDVILDSSLFRSAMTRYLLKVRKALLCEMAITVNSKRSDFWPQQCGSPDASKSNLKYLVSLIWIIATARDAEKRMGSAAELECVKIGDVIQIKGKINNKDQLIARVFEILPAVEERSLPDLVVKIAAEDKPLTLNSQNARLLFSVPGLENALSALEKSIIMAVQNLHKPRLDEMFITGEKAESEAHMLHTSFPSFLDQHCRSFVVGIVRDHVNERFSRWSRATSRNPNEKKFAGELSKILVVFESFTGERNKDSQNLLDDIDHSLRNHRSSGHRFSELLKSQRLLVQLEMSQPVVAAYHKMKHLQSHRDDPPVDGMRDVVTAIAMSLIDLGRLHVQELSHADIVKMSSSRSSVLLPASVARDLDNLKSTDWDNFVSDTLLLALQNLAACLGQPRVVECIASSARAILWQMVSAIPLNYVSSHASDFPPSSASRAKTQLNRWSLISQEIWGEIDACMDKISDALIVKGQSAIKLLKVPATGVEFTQDPMKFLDWCEDVSSPLVLWSSSCPGNDSVDKDQVLTWWESGLEMVQSMEHRVDSSVSTSQNVGLGGSIHSLNASAAPFCPHEQTLIDLEGLQRQADLKSAARFIAGFFKRRLQQDAYLKESSESEMSNQQHLTSPDDAQITEMPILSADVFLRSSRYKGLRETNSPRAVWNHKYFDDHQSTYKYFDEATLPGGRDQYDFLRSRYLNPMC